MNNFTSHDIAKFIDHALLKPEMTRNEVKEGCLTAIKYDTASVCVRSSDVAFAYDILKDSSVLTCAVIGFPHGSQSTESKVCESLTAIKQGAAEIDMVIPIGLAKGGDFDIVANEINEIVKVAHDGGAIVKVIFENCYLNKDTIIKLCEISAQAGADYVKTSTGFAASGATVEDIALMRKHTPEHIGVKASGGIRTLDDLLGMVKAGANRIGASATENIVKEAVERFGR